jgi:hypothetical protein
MKSEPPVDRLIQMSLNRTQDVSRYVQTRPPRRDAIPVCARVSQKR